MAVLFDGKSFASKKEKEVKKKIERLRELGVVPKLASILIGDNPASKLYVGLKKKAAERVGAELDIYFLPEKTKVGEIMQLIDSLNTDETVNGIMIQLPLPKVFEANKEEIVERIDSNKDVDGLKKESLFVHPTSKAVIQILEFAKDEVEVSVKKVCVVGSTGMVGAPLVKELKRLGFDVLECDTNTPDIKQKTLEADALISATGVPGLITQDMIKGGAIVIDVGSPKGDVDFDKIKEVASFVTPVPGGVGPITITSLLENLISKLSFDVEIKIKYIE